MKERKPGQQAKGKVVKELSIQFRVDEEQYDALRRAALREGGDSLGNWCRRHLLEQAGWEHTEH